MLKLIVALVAVSLSTVAQAQQKPRWAMLGMRKDATSVTYIDTGTVHDDGKTRRAWRAMVYGEPHVMGTKRIYAQRVLDEYDCSQNRSRSLYYVVYGSDGNVIQSWNSDDARWSFDIPGSIGDLYSAAACGVKTYDLTRPDFDPITEMAAIRSVLTAR